MIETAIKRNGTPTFFHKGSIKAAQNMLSQNEEFMYAAIVNISIVPILGGLKPNITNIKNKISGVIVVTSKRIFFCNNVAGKGISKQIMLKDIISIDDSTSLLQSTKLRISGISEMFIVDGNAKTNRQLLQVINEAKL